MKKTIVVKFGGSCLSTPSSIMEAARKVAREVNGGKRVVVVVSALSGVTDQLIGLAKEATQSKVSREEMDEIMAMGERTAVRLVTAALNSQGIDAIGIDPESSLWPILTDANFGNAEVDLEETRKKVSRGLLPLIDQGKTLVIAGFIGKTLDGKITTLGRGGSDITAMVLGNCLDAEEVVFVKDVGGILSADPKKVTSPQKIDALMVEEAYSLASAGAKVIQPKALTYKRKDMSLRVVGFDSPDLSGGTIITGELKTGLNAELYPSTLSMITLITPNGSLQNVARALAEASSTGAEVLGLTVSSSSILMYVQDSRNLVEQLHTLIKREGVAKAIHSVDNLAMIVISGYGLEDTPGILETTIQPLAKEGINLYGVFTISSSIRIFVPWNEREKALSSIRDVLNSFKGEA
jgi:aspartate kinase